MMTTITGGCQCGRIRYRAELATDEAYLCHCRMCQRATGGVSIAFANMPQAALAWETEPDWYFSSAIAKRPFCAQCGTPLGFSFIEGDAIDITVGSFDDPGFFRPHHHFGTESLHEAWVDTSALPRERADAYQPLTDRWVAATGKTPE